MGALECMMIQPEEAVSSLNATSGGRNYFFLDIRNLMNGYQGILATGVTAEGKVWKTPMLVEGIISCLKELKPTVRENARE